MADMMEYPKTPNEFIKNYSFKDSDEIYTNGVELVPVFRVEQMLEHYYKPLKEKAIPKKLRIKGTGYKTYTCPICFACYANEGSFKFAQQRNKTYGSDSFCSRCGNALDWSESEE